MKGVIDIVIPGTGSVITTIQYDLPSYLPPGQLLNTEAERALIQGDLQKIVELCVFGDDHTKGNRTTALAIALRFGHEAVVEHFLQEGCSTQVVCAQPTSDGCIAVITALGFATLVKNRTAVRALRARNVISTNDDLVRYNLWTQTKNCESSTQIAQINGMEEEF